MTPAGSGEDVRTVSAIQGPALEGPAPDPALRNFYAWQLVPADLKNSSAGSVHEPLHLARMLQPWRACRRMPALAPVVAPRSTRSDQPAANRCSERPADCEPAEIDVELVPIVQLRWCIGFRTISSCQGVVESLEPTARALQRLAAEVQSCERVE